MARVSQLVAAEVAAQAPFIQFSLGSRWSEQLGKPGIFDFVVGNPLDGVLPEVSEALARATNPRSKDWFAYKLSEPASQEVMAASLARQTGVPFEPADIAMTNGGFAGLAVALRAIVNPGDEVIYVSPPWFFYTLLIRAAGGTPVQVRVDDATLDLDPAAIEAAVTERTAAVIVNTPHNPTGRIASPATLTDLAQRLERASQRIGRPVFLVSDEAYRRIVFDEADCPTPAAYYPWTFVVYTFGKTLLAPGERIGFIALPPTMPEREEIRTALLMAQVMTGYAFTNALAQHAIADLDAASIDIARLQRRRDCLVSSLREAGYDVTNPQGTFYLLARVPGDDEQAFIDKLASRDVFVLPGTLFEMPGYFRISLTATDEMVERAIPIFRDAIR